MSKLPDIDKVLERAMMETAANGGLVAMCLDGIAIKDFIPESEKDSTFVSGYGINIDSLTHEQKHNFLEVIQRAAYMIAIEIENEHDKGVKHNYEKTI